MPTLDELRALFDAEVPERPPAASTLCPVCRKVNLSVRGVLMLVGDERRLPLPDGGRLDIGCVRNGLANDGCGTVLDVRFGNRPQGVLDAMAEMLEAGGSVDLPEGWRFGGEQETVRRAAETMTAVGIIEAAMRVQKGLVSLELKTKALLHGTFSNEKLDKALAALKTLEAGKDVVISDGDFTIAADFSAGDDATTVCLFRREPDGTMGLIKTVGVTKAELENAPPGTTPATLAANKMLDAFKPAIDGIAKMGTTFAKAGEAIAGAFGPLAEALKDVDVDSKFREAGKALRDEPMLIDETSLSSGPVVKYKAKRDERGAPVHPRCKSTLMVTTAPDKTISVYGVNPKVHARGPTVPMLMQLCGPCSEGRLESLPRAEDAVGWEAVSRRRVAYCGHDDKRVIWTVPIWKGVSARALLHFDDGRPPMKAVEAWIDGLIDVPRDYAGDYMRAARDAWLGVDGERMAKAEERARENAARCYSEER